MQQSRTMMREIGTACAVLAIYLLTILTPLHHARASQYAFEALGYETLATGWVLCTPAGVTGQDSDTAAVAKCPATGIAKQDFLEPSPAVLHLGAPTLSVAVHYAPLDHGGQPGPDHLAAAPRGPPASV